MARRATAVLGMHRSGTSAVAGLLVELGLTPPGDPLPPHPDNPKGYVEPMSAVQTNEAMLAEVSSSWFDLGDVDEAMTRPALRQSWVERARTSLRDSFGEAGDIVLKEPRINRLWPVWRDALAAEGFDIRCVTVARDPAETAHSLHRRDGCGLAYAGALWLRHTAAAERASRGEPRHLIDYGALIGDPDAERRRLADFIGADALGDTGAFVDPGLRREVGDEARRDPLFRALTQVHAAFVDLIDEDSSRAQAGFDAAVRAAEAEVGTGDLIRAEMIRLWEGERLARKKARAWRRRALKAEQARDPPHPSGPSDIYAAVPEAVVQRVRDSGLFDDAWYLSRHPEVAEMAVDPVRHYLAVGAALGHDPGPLFETDLYVRQMADSDRPE